MRAVIIFLFVFTSLAARAQTWEPLGQDSFEAIYNDGDTALVIQRGDGSYIRSSDGGASFASGERRVANGESREGSEALHALRHLLARGAELVLDDSSNILLSRDAGKSWARVVKKPAGEGASLHAMSIYKGVVYAIGEPGLVLVSDNSFEHWREIHRAPYLSEPRFGGISGLTGLGSMYSKTLVDFWSTTVGAVAVNGEVFLTRDSGVSWSVVARSERAVTSLLMISDTSFLAAAGDSLWDGRTWRSGLHGRQIGWTNRSTNEIYVLTDSNIYFSNTSLESFAPINPPMNAGEQFVAAAFPNKYTGFLVTRTEHLFDTSMTIDFRTVDTTLRFDTSYAYRTTDGGDTWATVQSFPFGMNDIACASARTVVAVGDHATIRRSGDTGRTWSRAFSPIWQNVRTVRFVNENMGYIGGDSGLVAFSPNGGSLWRSLLPDPVFTHPRWSYTSIAFPDARTVVVASNGRAYRQPIRDPFASPRFRRKPRMDLPPLYVTVSPNPAKGVVHIHISSKVKSTSGETPLVTIVDENGRTMLDSLACSRLNDTDWESKADLSTMSVGRYVAVVTLDGQTGRSNIVLEH